MAEHKVEAEAALDTLDLGTLVRDQYHKETVYQC